MAAADDKSSWNNSGKTLWGGRRVSSTPTRPCTSEGYVPASAYAHVTLVFTKGAVIPCLERFSNECRKTKTKVITPANHNKHKLPNEPIRTRSKYMLLASSAGKNVRARASRD